MPTDKAAPVKRSKSKDLWREGKPQFHTVLTAEEARQFDMIQAAWNLPSKAEAFRWMLKDCHERTTTREHETIVGMFGKVLGAMESLLSEQTQFRTDLTRDVLRLVERAGGAADRITLVSEAATEKIGARVESSIAITRQMELDLKEQLAAANKMLFSLLIRIKSEQAFLRPEVKDVLTEALKQSGLSGV